MHPEFEMALLNWVNEIHAEGVNVSSKMIIEMGIRIRDRVNEKLPDEKKIHSTFSNGLLFKFQRRWGLRSLFEKSYEAIIR